MIKKGFLVPELQRVFYKKIKCDFTIYILQTQIENEYAEKVFW